MISSNVNMIRTDLTGGCTFLIIISFDRYMIAEIASIWFIIRKQIQLDGSFQESNPFVTNGLSHPYHLDEPTFIFRMRCLICGYTVCLCPINRTPGVFGLSLLFPRAPRNGTCKTGSYKTGYRTACK